VVKIGSSSITDERGEIARPAIEKLCSEVAGLRSQGHRVVVVTSGAIAAGIPVLGLPGGTRPVDPAILQAVSAVGQSRLMAVYDQALGAHGLVAGQVLLAPLDFFHRSQYVHAKDTLRRLLDLGVVPVVNENDAVADDEIRFGDNDRLASLVANLVSADLLVLLTDAPGLLTAYSRQGVFLDVPVAVGTGSTPTPTGNYFIDGAVKVPYDDGPYGAYQLSVSAFSNVYYSFGGGIGQIAIHGTNNPALIGTPASNGCVRMTNEDITLLAHTVPVGTPVQIV
jgi:isopentenyl phosphate kinase